MSFKRIEVTGFKSFADSLSIEFDSGITAIVGPNGCGKSNIADAIRWGLGEQSSKLLRGDNMQDVIFKGAEGRKGLSFCEVALVFDNSDNRFNLDYDEVVISRKLFRSGDREYALNRTPCLLKDINNILHDSGIGRDGYSIIGQGRVEQIVSSKPEHRREIFEEAAGIAKHKERKTEAERKLANTRDNIVRLQDIYSEVERQLAPMQKQAETAKTFLGLRDELKIYEVNHYIFTYENAERYKRQITELIEGLQQEVEYKTKLVADAVEKHNKSLDGIKNIDEQIASLSEQMLALSVGIEKQAGDYRLAQAKLDYMREQSEKLQSDLKSQRTEFEKINTELLDKQSQKSARLDTLETLRVQADEIQKVYLAVVGQINASEDLLSGNQTDLSDTITKLTDIKTTISRLQAEIKSLNERNTELADKQQVLSDNMAELNNSLSSAEKTRLSLDTERKTLSDSIQALRDNIRTVEIDKHALNNELSVNLDKLSQLRMRQKMLNEMQAEYEGYNGTVRKLLVDASKNAELTKLVVGVVAELMTVPREYETAIEMALGAGVQNIVTNNEDDAKKLVTYLKSNNYGRATFLPINKIKPKFINDSLRGLLSTKGCFGIASDLITYDSKLKPIFQGLLGSTVIVDNMDTAVKLANDSRFGFKIVTLDGDIINPAGSITGGSKKSVINNLLSRDREIEEVNANLNTTESLVEELQAKVAKYNATYTQLVEELNATTDKLHTCEIELTQADDNYQNIKNTSTTLNNELHTIQDDKARITTRIQLLQSELDTSLQLDKISDLPASNSQKGDNSYTLLRNQRDELSEKLTNIKIGIATTESECTSLDAEIERLLGEQASLSEEIDETTSLLVKNTKTMETAIALSNGATDDETLSLDKKKLDSVKEEIAELTKLKEELHIALNQIEKERTLISTELSKVQEKLFQQEAKLGQIDTNVENLQQRIMDDYELTYLTALDMKVEDFDDTVGVQRINELKREISKLGYVNVNAIEESKVLSERYEELTIQMDDLLKAEADILAIIRDLATQMTEKFDDAFQKINANFSKIFRELFGGGNARLVLTTDDILTAGVDIFAEPPGKSLGGNLSLLSGGEKSLTAIAILFAILKLRPMPFCLLDEIDAALDDANVERFAKYLHRFAGDTQFIVVTHRKPTMELADTLYGVTMENKGVSKVVSVKLSEAIAAVGNTD